MKIYNYNDQTGEYIGEGDAKVVLGREHYDDSNLAKWRIPAQSTTIAPPEANTGCVVCFNNTEWEQIEDHRNEIVYFKETGERIEITGLGPLPSGTTSQEYPGDGYVWDIPTNSWIETPNVGLKIYDYDMPTGEYVGERYAKVVPGREGFPDDDMSKWRIPAQTTTIAPPEANDGCVVCFNEDTKEWMQVEDHRGLIGYFKEDGSVVEIVFPGPLPDFITLLEYPGDGYVWDVSTNSWVLAPPIVPQEITRRQMLIGLKTAGVITTQEAIDAATTGTVPPGIAVIFDNLPTQEERDNAAITWASMSVAERQNPLVLALAAANSMTEDDLDQFFITAAAL